MVCAIPSPLLSLLPLMSCCSAPRAGGRCDRGSRVQVVQCALVRQQHDAHAGLTSPLLRNVPSLARIAAQREAGEILKRRSRSRVVMCRLSTKCCYSTSCARPRGHQRPSTSSRPSRAPCSTSHRSASLPRSLVLLRGKGEEGQTQRSQTKSQHVTLPRKGG